MSAGPDSIVVALGGNAIARPGDDGSIGAQCRRADEALADVADLACDGARIVLTHGNGPVVGNIVLRGELAAGQVPPMPLFIAGADSEGGIGLVLQQSLGNLLRDRQCPRPVAAVVTQALVDPHDPAFNRPTKPIGPYYSAEASAGLTRERGWTMTEGDERGFRRVVASPYPLEVIEAEVVATLADAGVIVIAAGGGGVPVRRNDDGHLTGVDAVIDKDWTSAVLAVALDVEMLAILMEADAVYADWGTLNARALRELTVVDAAELVSAGSLSAGGIRPKVEAAVHFARHTGRDAIICAGGSLAAALAGDAGTRVLGERVER